MSEPDVTDALEGWRDYWWAHGEQRLSNLARDARAEILALRDIQPNPFEVQRAIDDAIRLARAEALEEAALEAGKWATGKAARSAIRAMKVRPL